MRLCQKCGTEKPTENFITDKRRSDGVRTECKDCTYGPPKTVECPICHTERILSGSTARHYQAKPWFCWKCGHNKRVEGRRKRSVQCAKCERWYVRMKNSKGDICGRCRQLVPQYKFNCEWCGKEYWPTRKDQRFCRRSCNTRHNRNLEYFDGRMREARGWAQRQCQACSKIIQENGVVHVHHVFGHPDHSLLVVLCAGCHQLISKMAWRKYNNDALSKLISFAAMQRDGGPSEIRVEILVAPCDEP